MTINYTELTTSFTISHIEWERCMVTCWEGWGWDDSTSSCTPENGDKDNPVTRGVMAYDYIKGWGQLVSLVPGVVPEPGWKVIGYLNGDERYWVCIPPWYVFPPKTKAEGPPLMKMVAAVLIGFISVWGAINLVSPNTGNQPQSTFQSK